MPTKIAPIQLPDSTALGLYADRDPIAVEDQDASSDHAGPNEAFRWTQRRESAFLKEHDQATGVHRTVKIARAVAFLWYDGQGGYIVDPESSVNEVTVADDPSILQVSRLSAGKVLVKFPGSFGGDYAIQNLSKSERITAVGGGSSWEWVDCVLMDATSTDITVERFTSGAWKDGHMAFAFYSSR